MSHRKFLQSWVKLYFLKVSDFGTQDHCPALAEEIWTNQLKTNVFDDNWKVERLDCVGLSLTFLIVCSHFCSIIHILLKKKSLNHRSISPFLYHHNFNLRFYCNRRHCTANYGRCSLTRGNFLHIIWNVAQFISLCHSFPISKKDRMFRVSL